MLLMPIFVGFLITHGGFIVFGVLGTSARLPSLVPDTIHETSGLAAQIGWGAVAGIVLQAFALGGGTYTGIEAVSNNIHMLREPRMVTGALDLTYMATSLSIAAGGLIVLYLLWGVAPEYGRTLNAVTFRLVLAQLSGFTTGRPGSDHAGHPGYAAGLLSWHPIPGSSAARGAGQYGHRSLDAPPISPISPTA